MQMQKADTCFLCNRNRHAGRLELHHIFGGARRKLSDKYGLVVTLCEECHRTSAIAVHQDARTMQYLHEYGQRKAMQENGWDVQTFREIFGKNYLQEE
jgi:lysyl-tRNA synthetase class I